MRTAFVSLRCTGPAGAQHAAALVVDPVAQKRALDVWVGLQLRLHRERFPECTGALELSLAWSETR